MLFDRSLVEEGTVLYRRAQGVPFTVARVTKVLQSQARVTVFDPESGETGRSFRVTLQRGKEVGARTYGAVYWRILGTIQFGPTSLADIIERNERARARMIEQQVQARKHAEMRWAQAQEALRGSGQETVGHLRIHAFDGCQLVYGITHGIDQDDGVEQEIVTLDAVVFHPMELDYRIGVGRYQGETEEEALLRAIEGLVL